ncbi:Uncharacterised protein [Yersinia enterocolitica]|nr:Uncharacterised protein [Yersinia enterocolitica]CRY31698.1 Uncharacterised protein [Yersinia enterocolitica]
MRKQSYLHILPGYLNRYLLVVFLFRKVGDRE